MAKQNLGVIILSGGSSKDKMPGFPIFRSSPAFLPINSRSLGKFVIDFYLEQNCEIYLAMNSLDFAAAEQEFACYSERVHILDVGDTGSVVESLEKALASVQEEEIVVNLVTTIPKVLAGPNSLVVDDKEQLAEAWSAITIEKGKVRFIKKAARVADVGYAFSGILRAARKSLNAAVKEVPSERRKDLLEVAEKLHLKNPVQIQHADWFDCGHIQNYFKTRQKIFGSRFFNSISLDDERGVITKTSTNGTKLMREVDYIAKLPKDLQLYFPRLVDVEQNAKSAKVSMEFYGYPTLAETILYWDLPPSLWNGIFERLSSVLRHFQRFPGQAPSEVWREIYVQKVSERLDEYRKQSQKIEDSSLFGARKVVLNGSPLLSWDEIEGRLDSFAKKLKKDSDLCVIHGDFCFNNILCEPYMALVKLLDPRGSFGENFVGTVGDRKYDWAKLGHSVVGKYDYIVNDLFRVQRSSGAIELEIYDRPWQSEIEEIYWSYCEKAGMDVSTINFIMGGLFVSMTPLHKGRADRQLAFYLTGLRLFSEALK